jgi:hypothetical protein
MQRRTALRALGGGLLLAGAGAGGFLTTRTPTSALVPWTEEPDFADVRLRILSTAVLAPNPHNRQPWLVRLEGQHDFVLYAQSDRKLPHTDPFDRQITIGLGCFLELARMAASAGGFKLSIESFPKGEPEARLDARPVARCSLSPVDTADDELFAFVKARRSCKEPFLMDKRPSQAQLDTIVRASTNARAAVSSTHDETRVQRLRSLAWDGHVIEISTPRTYKESIDLMRIGRAEVEANPDDIDLGGPFLGTLHFLGMLDRNQLADSHSSAYQHGLDAYQAMFAATPAFVWVSTSDNSRAAQLGAGASWLRLNLAATRDGLALHPVSQMLQEYEEMRPLYGKVHNELEVAEPGRVQMLGRIGYGPATEPSPRWPLLSRLVPA